MDESDYSFMTSFPLSAARQRDGGLNKFLGAGPFAPARLLFTRLGSPSHDLYRLLGKCDTGFAVLKPVGRHFIKPMHVNTTSFGTVGEASAAHVLVRGSRHLIHHEVKYVVHDHAEELVT